jgi:hypothetical protein
MKSLLFDGPLAGRLDEIERAASLAKVIAARSSLDRRRVTAS